MQYLDLTIQRGSDFTNVFPVVVSGLPMNLTGYSAYIHIIQSPGVLSPVSFSTNSGIVNDDINGTLTWTLTANDVDTISGIFYSLEIDNGTSQISVYTGNMFILSDVKDNLEYLIPALRMQIGDTVPSAYRYLDEWLNVALISAIKALQRWWGDKYLIDTYGIVTRNTLSTFSYDEPNIIQSKDERPIILMASILIKSGQLESNSWNVGSWKDAEVAVSNIEGSRSKQFGIGLDWEELKMYVIPPTKRLSTALRIPHPITEE